MTSSECNHSTVRRAAQELESGHVRDFWQCSACGERFVMAATTHAQHAELASLRQQVIMLQADADRVHNIEKAVTDGGTVEFSGSPNDSRGFYCLRFKVVVAEALSRGFTLREAIDGMWGKKHGR